MSIRFPNESDEYRTARNRLLEAERELREKTEAVAAQRRALPLGGEITTDYVFDEGPTDLESTSTAKEVRLSGLFGNKDTLVLYGYMFGPTAKAPCPLCTSFLDGLEGQAHHLTQHVALAVSARSPIARVRELGRARGWRRLRLLSSSRSGYQRDYHAEIDDAHQMPMMNIFAKRDGKVFHTWGSELLYAENPEGMDSRHIDILWPLWNVLDLTPAGRGTQWYPKLGYEVPALDEGAARSTV